MNLKKFDDYEAVRQSGLTNMFDVKRVCELSGLNKEDVIDIMKNYGKYKELKAKVEVMKNGSW